MILRALLLLCSLSLLGTFAPEAMAAPEGAATKTVRRVNTSIAKTLTSKTQSKDESKLLEEARAQLGDFLDIDELGRRAMQDHWSKLSSEQQKEFLSLLRQLIETNYLRGLRSRLSYEVSYLGEGPKGKFVEVKTVVKSKRKGRPLKIEVNYLLSKSGNSWRTFDISTDGIGLVENYRGMFNRIIAKSGTEDLLKRMRSKLAELTKKVATPAPPAK